MRDLFELWGRVFECNRKPKKSRFDGVNINPAPGKVLPPTTKPIKVEVTVKNKDRIQQLEDELKELREQSDNQTQLLLKLADQLSALQRDIANANILPEK